jgi:hypothetical protein
MVGVGIEIYVEFLYGFTKILNKLVRIAEASFSIYGPTHYNHFSWTTTPNLQY